MMTAEGTKPKISSGFSKSSSVKTFRGKDVIRPNGKSLPDFICMKTFTAESCSLTPKVSVSVRPSCKRICMRVLVYSFFTVESFEVVDDVAGDWTGCAGGSIWWPVSLKEGDEIECTVLSSKNWNLWTKKHRQTPGVQLKSIDKNPSWESKIYKLWHSTDSSWEKLFISRSAS